MAHALGAWKSWLAGRGSGLVPIADPRSFQWAGWWIGVVDDSTSPLADGPARHGTAVQGFMPDVGRPDVAGCIDERGRRDTLETVLEPRPAAESEFQGSGTRLAG